MGTELHTLKAPEGHRKKRKRVGRGPGSGKGKTSTRGMKGQLARNNAVRVGFEGGQNPIHRRVPKRGFTNIHRVEVFGVNVSRLDSVFAAGAEVTPESLHDKGLVPKKATIIKILGTGDLTKKLAIKVHRISGSAREKVEKAGGSIELLPQRQKSLKDKNEDAG
jgi:large subunit ribosomal protein L15